MGSSSILDIIGSFITGGILLMIVVQLNLSSSESRQLYGYDYRNQTNLTAVSMMIEDDFSRIGYVNRINANPQQAALIRDSLNQTSDAILLTQRNCFQYRTDVDDDSNIDVVEYSIASSPDNNETSIDKDYYLTKKVWNNSLRPSGDPTETIKWNIGVTTFAFNYKVLNAAGDRIIDATLPIANPDDINKIVEIEINVELSSTERPDFLYSTDTNRYDTYWKQLRVASKMLQLQQFSR